MAFTKKHAEENRQMLKAAQDELARIGYSYPCEKQHKQIIEELLMLQFPAVSQRRIRSQVVRALLIARGRDGG